MDRLPIRLLTCLLLITLWNTVTFKPNLTSSHGLHNNYAFTSSVKMSSESQKILNQCFQQEESNQSFQQWLTQKSACTYIHHNSPWLTWASQNTVFKWGHRSTYPHSGKESVNNHQNLFFFFKQYFLPVTCCRFGVLTAELWIPGQSTPVSNSNVGKFSMMLPYSNQERHKTPLTHPSS